MTAMAREIRTEIIINAPAGKVWKILTDFNAYPQWNPFINTLTGDVKVGNKIKVKITPPDASAMKFTPKVLTFDENRKLSWLGHLLIPGIFDGEHIFELIANADGTTTFIHRENFKGILVPLSKKMLEVNTRNGFIEMNNKLKELAEKV
jgi:hypothetical protein